MADTYKVYTICHISVIYLVYTCHMKCHSIPGIYLVYTFQMKLCTPHGQHTGIGLQGCSMFCGATGHPSARARQWPDSGPGGKVAPPTSVEPPPPTPTAAAAGQSRRRCRRQRGRRRWGHAAHAASADAHCRGSAGAPQPTTTTTTKRKSCRLDVESKC
jgi:hypothetical protein